MHLMFKKYLLNPKEGRKIKRERGNQEQRRQVKNKEQGGSLALASLAQ